MQGIVTREEIPGHFLAVLERNGNIVDCLSWHDEDFPEFRIFYDNFNSYHEVNSENLFKRLIHD